MPSSQKEKNHLEMSKALEQINDPALKKVLMRIAEKIKQDTPFQEVEKVKTHIVNTPQKGEQQVLAFMPHEMAKVSIFFPMSDKELREEKRKISLIEHESNWGKVKIEGVKLAIFEEDVFLALMKIAKEKISCSNGQYILETTMQEIAKILYGEKGYTERAYKVIRKTLEHFQLIRFSVALFDKTKKEYGGGSIGNIIQSFYPEYPKKEVKIYFNPHFCLFFLESMLTNINFTLRRKLKKDGSKALLRFLTTHNQPTRMHVLTVLKAINYNIDQPMYTLRRKLKQFIVELKVHEVLGKKTKLYKDDTIYFDILPHKKSLPE